MTRTVTVEAVIQYDAEQTEENAVIQVIEEIVNLHGEGMYTLSLGKEIIE